MAKHQTPADGAESDGKVELDVADLVEMLEEPGGKHSAGEDEDEE